MKAYELAHDDDYSLSCDLFDSMCNNDEIREEFNYIVAAHLEGRHVSLSECDLILKMVKFAEDFYKEHEDD